MFKLYLPTKHLSFKAISLLHTVTTWGSDAAHRQDTRHRTLPPEQLLSDIIPNLLVLKPLPRWPCFTAFQFALGTQPITSLPCQEGGVKRDKGLKTWQVRIIPPFPSADGAVEWCLQTSTLLSVQRIPARHSTFPNPPARCIKIRNV